MQRTVEQRLNFVFVEVRREGNRSSVVVEHYVMEDAVLYAPRVRSYRRDLFDCKGLPSTDEKQRPAMLVCSTYRRSAASTRGSEATDKLGSCNAMLDRSRG